MEELTPKAQHPKKGFRAWLQKLVGGIPLIGWLWAIFGAVLIEYYLGDLISYYLGLPKIPVLFGFLTVLKKPLLLPGTMGYLILVYGLPILLIAKSIRKPANKLAAFLDRGPVSVGAVIHLGLFYGAMHFWTDMSDYRLLVLKLTMIAIMLTLSINVINGYMGEFSCSHPGFMALGAYGASTITLLLFANDKLFGEALLPEALGFYFFPLALIAGGLVASLGALVIAIPSFRTRLPYRHFAPGATTWQSYHFPFSLSSKASLKTSNLLAAHGACPANRIILTCPWSSLSWSYASGLSTISYAQQWERP